MGRLLHPMDRAGWVGLDSLVIQADDFFYLILFAPVCQFSLSRTKPLQIRDKSPRQIMMCIINEIVNSA